MSKIVFLDANILQSLSKDKFRDSANSMLEIISKLDKDYDFAATFFQRYEFLRGINTESKQKKHLGIIDQFRYFESRNEIFEFIRVIYLVYKEIVGISPKEGDLILATCNMLMKDSAILTADIKHFPISFFKIIKKFDIKNKDNKYKATAVLVTIDRKRIIKAYDSIFTKIKQS